MEEKEKFSLKDHLFNESKVSRIAAEIKRNYPSFDDKSFIKETAGKFPSLELKQRITWIAENLRKYLPQSYQDATNILLKSLPPENDHTKTDDDFGEFIYAPYAEFVAKYGCSEENFTFSLDALKEITMRFSAEDAIRYFINAFPRETLVELLKWSKDRHYHVRRLTSEGTRPKLPWAQKINIAAADPLPILDNLYLDKTRFVTRSVANHMNDISKVNPELALKVLEKWQKSDKQEPKEMDYIIKHALRSLIKQGHPDTISFLGFSVKPQVKVSKLLCKDSTVRIGDAVIFEFTLEALKDEKVIIDYTIYFRGKKENGNNKKVFKLKQLSLKKGETVTIQKRHPLRKNMTTRELYPGKHRIEIQINGQKMGEVVFDLIA